MPQINEFSWFSIVMKMFIMQFSILILLTSINSYGLSFKSKINLMENKILF